MLTSVTSEFAAVLRLHASQPADTFNLDDKYKHFTSEAIEAKSLALEKIRIYAQQSISGAGEDLLAFIRDRPLMDFADRSVILELLTGLTSFPWMQVTSKSVKVDLGSWAPDGVEEKYLRTAGEELAANGNLREVTFGNEGTVLNLRLSEGLKSKQFELSGSPAILSALSSVFWLLGACTDVEAVDLR